MALKHSIADTEQPTDQIETRAPRKRARLLPPTTPRDSSAMPPSSVSEDSALTHSTGAAVREQESSVSSAPSYGTADSDSSMESSDDSASSSQEQNHDDDDHDDGESMREEADVTVTLGAPKKPTMNAGTLSGASDLASRLRAFLPQMQQANNELAPRGTAANMEDVDNEEEHIEMSLGLGVLEQKRTEDIEDLLRKKSQSRSDDQKNAESDDEDSPEHEPDVLDRLMNMERNAAKAGQPSIEEVSDSGNVAGTTLANQVAAARNCLGKVCHVSSEYSTSSGVANDSPAIAAAFVECGQCAVIAFTNGVDYNVPTPVKATNLSDVMNQMQGNLHLPRNLTHVRDLYDATLVDSGGNLHWFHFAGFGVHYKSTPNVTTGWIKSNGQEWWDGQPENGTGIDGRPYLCLWNITDSTIDHLKPPKPIAWTHRLTGRNITVTNAIADAFSTGGFPFNTDGFQCAGTDITITISVIYNGDDAIAINSGAHNVVVGRLTMGYQSCGMSNGSLGKDVASYGNVSDILFDDVTVVSALYAAASSLE